MTRFKKEKIKLLLKKRSIVMENCERKNWEYARCSNESGLLDKYDNELAKLGFNFQKRLINWRNYGKI